MKKITYQRIAQSLEAKNIIDSEEIKQALKRSLTVKMPFIGLLIEITQRSSDDTKEFQLKRELSKLLEIPYIVSANECKVNMDLTRQVGTDDIDKTKAFIVDYKGRHYAHAIDPMNAEANSKIDAVAKVNNCDYCLIAPNVLNTLITRDVAPILIADRAKTLDTEHTADGVEDESEKNDDEYVSTDIAKMFGDIVNAGINSRASDIHLCPEKKCAVIKFRVDGVLRQYMPIPLSALTKLSNYIVSQAKIPEPEKPKAPRDGALEFAISKKKSAYLRISIIEDTLGRDDICVRILNNREMTLEMLGLCKEHQEVVHRLFKMTKGIVLFVGPTGSGKSTSMYAGLRATDYEHRRVMTVEDPVEQEMAGVLQVSTNDDAGMSYDEAIKAFLRHDPDIIGIGEIRDNKVGSNAMRASETGHLVISTLHCNSAPMAVSRLRGIDIPTQSIASSLSAVIAQRLVRRVCPECAEAYELEADHPWRKMFNLGDGKIVLRKGKGCSACENLGYKGRTVITEIMLCNRELRAAIEAEAPSIEIEKLAAADGYKPLLQDGIQKALDGITTFDEIEAIYNDIV